ncbi:MAG: endopeptidase [Vicinamibacteria bacterium]
MSNRIVGLATAAVVLAALSARPAAALVPPEKAASELASKAFSAPELTMSTSNVPLADIRSQLPGRAAWDALTSSGSPVQAYIDPRSGAATNIIESVPLLPGTGVRNRVTLADVGRRLGRAVSAIDATVVADAVLAHVRDRRVVLGIDPAQLGPVRASRVGPQLWQVGIPQRYRGVPVRHGRLVASISHGNLVVLGAESWGDVALASIEPAWPADAALEAGFAYAGGRSSEDEVLVPPALAIVPFAPPEHQRGSGFAGPVGSGYGHRLVWTFEFQRPPSAARWEVMVDAQSGTVLAMQDQNQYVTRQIVGGVYPVTNTEVCTVPQRCGRMQAGTPMPFADTGLEFAQFTNGAGVYDNYGTPAVTRLRGRYVHAREGCPAPTPGTLQGSPTGGIDLGGANGDHDCDGQSAGGDTAAARTVYYEANRIAEIARGYLPDNDWAQDILQATANRDIAALQSCNAFWDGTISFYGSGDGCRNAGEIAGVIDHEWGHGLDQNDANGILSNSSEGYADIAAIYRTQDSCVGHGFFETRDSGCGPSADGRGFNVDEAQTGGAHCATDCSGVREADFAKHADGLPDTPLGFVCSRCAIGSGPCGRQTHCAAAPQRQAAWDLATRDLRAAPFFFDSQTAFLRASRLFYEGSGNVGLWYSCECGGISPSSSGCGAGAGYEQWLVADDDNGSLLDGTPHMSALFAAFGRHGIACGTATVPNSDCGAVAQGRPELTVVPGVLQNRLEWTAVPGAARYGVFRSDDVAGCDYGKTKIADVPGTTFADGAVATGRAYAYTVMAAGTNERCFSRASNCATVTPPAEPFSVACTPSAVTPGPSAAVCTVAGTSGFASPVGLGCVGLPGVASCTFDPPTVTSVEGAPVSSTLRIQSAVSATPGTYPFQVRGVAAPNVSGPSVPMTLTVGAAAGGDLVAAFDPARRVPSCGTVVGRSCDSRALVVGRAASEPNPPNTIAGSCADGAAGSGSSDRVRVATVDGASFKAGRKVTITADVTARAAFADDTADFFFAADAANPVWQLAGSATPTAAGPQTLSVGYKLPAGTRQAVRVQFRGGGTPVACTPGLQDDRDDLVFAVAP